MNYARRGNKADLYVQHALERDGWTLGSRRHIGGAGDLLAVKLIAAVRIIHDVRLVEVKTTAGGPWERFGPVDRQALSLAAERAGATAWVAWKPPGRPLQMIPEEDWPVVRVGRRSKTHAVG